MANINGTNVAAAIVPFTTDDVFPTHLAMYGKGGHRSVQTVANRDSIPTSRRELGMTVYVIDENKTYKLTGDINLNTGWVTNDTVAGSNTQVIFNDNGVLSGDSNFIYDKTDKVLKITNSLETNAINGNCRFGAYTSGGGSNNTIIGTFARQNKIGDYIVAIGNQAGRYADNSSYKLYIESSTGRNQNNDYLIEGDFQSRWIKFNGINKSRISSIVGTNTTLATGTVTSFNTTSITDNTKTFTVNQFAYKYLVITSGIGSGKAYMITSNTVDTITISNNFQNNIATGSAYKIIDGTSMLYENCSTNYTIDLTNGDVVIQLPTVMDIVLGSHTSFTITANPNNNKLFILTSSGNVIRPGTTNQWCKVFTNPYKVQTFTSSIYTGVGNTDYWVYYTSPIGVLDPMITIGNTTTPNEVNIDPCTKIYKLNVASTANITIPIDSAYLPLLINNALTVELHINMTVASTITWPGNVTWIGGSAPTFNGIAKYCVVLRTMDAGTTWIANLAYTY